jgi:hypothetical protein
MYDCSLEQFKLADNGNEIRVEIDHVLPESQALKLVKILQRIPESFVSETIPFQTVLPVNNWAFPKSHAPSTIRGAHLRIVDCIEVVTAGAVARRASLVTSDSFGPSTSSRSLGSNSPGRMSNSHSSSHSATHMRRYNGELSSGETVQLFVAEVGTLGLCCVTLRYFTIIFSLLCIRFRWARKPGLATIVTESWKLFVTMLVTSSKTLLSSQPCPLSPASPLVSYAEGVSRPGRRRWRHIWAPSALAGDTT